MSISIESIKEAIAECPICSEYFSEDVRIPRRMPCCLQSICEPCLGAYSNGHLDISCPLCRKEQHLPDGVGSLPKEMLILRFLNHLKIRSNLAPACTDCPHGNTAMAKCNKCSIFLCSKCLQGHGENGMTRSHSTTTFEQAHARQLIRRSNSRQEPPEIPDDINELKKRSSEVGVRIEKLYARNRHIQQSGKSAVDQINKAFDDLVEVLQERRGILLSMVESKVEKETKSITRAVDSHKEIQSKLKTAIENGSLSSVDQVFDELPKDVDFARRGICFLPSHISHVASIIRATGVIRTVTFTPTERPEALDVLSHCHAVTLEPTDLTLENGVNVKLLATDKGLHKEYKTSSPWDQVVIIKDDKNVQNIICPYLEYDHSTASDDIITTYGPVIRNSTPESTLPDTGCRLQAQRTVLLSPPLILRDGKRSMFHVKLDFRLKVALPDYKMIFELAIINTPIDMGMTQNKNMAVWIGTSPTQKEYQNNVSLIVKYNRSNYFCKKICENKVGATRDLHLCFLFDESRRQIHVIDVLNAALLTTVGDVTFDRPLWTLMYLGRPDWTDIRGEIVSGTRVEVSKEMCKLLSTL